MPPFPPLYPPSDHAEFLNLKPAVRERAWSLDHAAREVHAAGRNQRVAACKVIAADMRKSWKSIYEPVRAFLMTHDWRVLIDRRRHSELWISTSASPSFHPAEFVRHWRSLVESQHRCAKTAYRLLILSLAEWRRGIATSAIPGYATPPPNAPGHRHPPKWSYRDLCRVLPTRLETDAVRLGRDAAMKSLPAIRTSRRGGYPGMEIQFDDRWIDVEAIVRQLLHQPDPRIAAIEYYSRLSLLPGSAPASIWMASTNPSPNGTSVSSPWPSPPPWAGAARQRLSRRARPLRLPRRPG